MDGGWYEVKQGEWVSKIATRFGFPNWEAKVWRHPNNAALAKRRDPNILHPGDLLFIPALATKDVPCATEIRHCFVVKGTFDTFHVRLLLADDTPMKNCDYILTIGAQCFTGTTDDNGEIHEARIQRQGDHTGMLVLPRNHLQFQVRVGDLNPDQQTREDDDPEYDDGLSGSLMRLRNLGYGPAADNQNAILNGSGLPVGARNAIALFQRLEMGLAREQITGKLDSDTREAIREKHQS